MPQVNSRTSGKRNRATPDPSTNGNLTEEELAAVTLRSLAVATDEYGRPLNRDGVSADVGRWVAKFREGLLTTADVKALKPAEPLIGGYLLKDSLAMLWGPPDVGKTFVALDWTLTVASTADTGWWQNECAVVGGPVVYVIAEGVGRFGKRIDAWERKHLHSSSYAHKLVWEQRAVNLADPDQVAAFIEVILPVAPVLVVFDTLARCTLGRDDGSNKEMGIVVDHLDDIRIATGACVLAIHHTGWDETRYRGASCIKGALNTELQLKPTGDESFWLNVIRQKDDPKVRSLHLSRVAVEDSGSCVVVPNSPVETEDRIGKGDLVTLEVLKRIQLSDGVASGSWHECHDPEIPKRTFHDRRARLVKKGVVVNIGTDKMPRYRAAE